MGASRRKLSLSQMGLIVVFASIVSPFVTRAVKPPANRSEALGIAVAQVVLLVTGVVLFFVGQAKERR